jgi:DNA-dependent RNA polymerase auxiliary subunit epsilon
MNQSFITAVSTFYVLTKHLQKVHQQIGTDNYLKSPVRYQHGTGRGVAADFDIGTPKKKLNATGNNDCAKERMRGITDSLGLHYDNLSAVKFRTASCINVVQTQWNKKIYHIEHTDELQHQYLAFEEEFILTNKPFTPADVAEWFVTKTIVTLIKRSELKKGNVKKASYDPDKPFSKYSDKVFYNGQDVSNLTKAEVLEIVGKEYAHIVPLARSYDWRPNVFQIARTLFKNPKHGIPPLATAVKYSNCAFSLLKYYYKYQRRQLTEAGYKPIYYNKELASMYQQWEQSNP